MLRRSVLLSLVLVGCAASPSTEPPPPQQSQRADALEQQLYSAELVMDHQEAIGLGSEQSDTIRGDLRAAQQQLVDAEWTLHREREALSQLLQGPRVEEPAALAAAERVTDAERAIKLIHLRLLIRIKNRLTPEQQAALDRLRQ
jgi:Spy/CpxP family protein refolding chaperone